MAIFREVNILVVIGPVDVRNGGIANHALETASKSGPRTPIFRQCTKRQYRVVEGTFRSVGSAQTNRRATTN
jgi:hypothetical protein